MDNQSVRILLIGSRGIGRNLFNTIIDDSMTVWYSPRRPIKVKRVEVSYFLPEPYSPFVGTQLREPDGFCLLVDSTDSCAIYEAQAIVRYMTLLDPLPHVIVATKQNHKDAFSTEYIHHAMKLMEETIVLPCEISERMVVDFALKVLLDLVRSKAISFLSFGGEGMIFD